MHKHSCMLPYLAHNCSRVRTTPGVLGRGRNSTGGIPWYQSCVARSLSPVALRTSHTAMGPAWVVWQSCARAKAPNGRHRAASDRGPSSGRPIGGRPIGVRLSGRRLSGRRPSGRRPRWRRPSGWRPSDGRPSGSDSVTMWTRPARSDGGARPSSGLATDLRREHAGIRVRAMSRVHAARELALGIPAGRTQGERRRTCASGRLAQRAAGVRLGAPSLARPGK
jgi:hypothetical protein